MEPADLGNILHVVMEELYRDREQEITAEVITELEGLVDKTVEHVINNEYKIPFEQLSGNDIINAEVIKELTRRILKSDKNYIPFRILSLEEGFVSQIMSNGNNYRLYGKFDRIDVKDEATRIIDYKTGNVEVKYSEMKELFSKPDKKTLFQLHIYSSLFHFSFPEKNFAAGFYVVRDLGSGITFPDIPIGTAEIEQFNSYLSDLIAEITDPQIAFTQTDELKRCKYCPYKSICNRHVYE